MLKYNYNQSLLKKFFIRWPLILIIICCGISESKFLLAIDSNFVYDSKGKRDPFIPLIGKNVKLTDAELLSSIEDVTVEGIIIDKKEGSAVIVNNQILKTGESLGGFRLEKIAPTYVVFSRDGKEYTLTYQQSDGQSQ
jgi:hypothetical protein